MRFNILLSRYWEEIFMTLENPSFRLMKYQGKLLYFSLALSGYSATSHNMETQSYRLCHHDNQSCIFKFCLSIYPSIYLSSILSFIYLLPYSKNDLDVLQIYTTIRDIKTKFKSKNNESKGRLG